jgi:hypothetical protein
MKVNVGRYGRCSEECGRALDFVLVLQSWSRSQLSHPPLRPVPGSVLPTLRLGG